MTHAVQKWGRAQVDAQMGWDLLLVEGLCYITGAIIYAVRLQHWPSLHLLTHRLVTST